VAETEKKEPEKPGEALTPESEDDRRAAAAAVNRKRTLEDWEAAKKKWLEMGVPSPLPAKK
jgi:hypothetical protein